MNSYAELKVEMPKVSLSAGGKNNENSSSIKISERYYDLP
jgi:hypothetical protein